MIKNLTKGVSYWVYLLNLLINYFPEVHYYAKAGGVQGIGPLRFLKAFAVPGD